MNVLPVYVVHRLLDGRGNAVSRRTDMAQVTTDPMKSEVLQMLHAMIHERPFGSGPSWASRHRPFGAATE
jgi:hypothetical protein